ncbi:precorrin-6A reductase [Sinanaerobacter chloroacetimidivorans]|uniref:precorrin-2 dehydrogenase n=1 Tax=Sinanaerobacter chloroacetimidivorans TaxID=2818044 RepID=A0A8J7W177_9FIRM|nr:precorrin-6A reductase [Sinanaerobacter chloroacetimidivorans]MBR0597333.1 precorrin-6A reductase [Sinanaerobacter chloroacetimidivorans]
MPKLLIFAGTTEGRTLLEALSRSIRESGIHIYACVATEYGRAVIPSGLEHITLRTGRMTEEEMTLFMAEHQFDLVIDTTHPYARLVSENIRAACTRSGCEYIRLLRMCSMPEVGEKAEGQKQGSDESCLFFKDHESAAEYLNHTSGNVLLTIGSKELVKYTEVKGYRQRLFPRVLPMPEVLEGCYELGFSGKQLICMQGPFSTELNTAFIRQIQAKYLVTKDSGEVGGFFEKQAAAQLTGAKLLVIGRIGEEEGISLEVLMAFLEKTYGIALRSEEPRNLGSWFPLFTNISGKEIVVVGAGRIAKRRIQTLLHFNCRVRVIAVSALDEVAALADQSKIKLQLKTFHPGDIVGTDYVLAATDSREVNQEIYEQCRENGIPVNVANEKEKSDFYFPGIIRKKGVTVGVTAEGKNHALAKKATRAIARWLDTGLEEDE